MTPVCWTLCVKLQLHNVNHSRALRDARGKGAFGKELSPVGDGLTGGQYEHTDSMENVLELRRGYEGLRDRFESR